MRTSMLLGVCFALCTLSSTAQAQLTFLGDPDYSLLDGPPSGGVYRLNDDVSSLQVSSTDDGFRITGDLTLYLDRSLPAPEHDYGQALTMDVRRYFEVGPLPVRIYGSLFENYEVVIGNGSPTSPAVAYGSDVSFWLDDPVGGHYNIPNRVSNLTVPPLVGNGVRIVDTDMVGDSFILAPGFKYYMSYFFSVGINSTGLGPYDPTPAVTFEFGGVSHFDGMDISVQSELVPEPSAAALAGAGGALAWAIALRKRASAKALRRAGQARRRS